ncbi:MAG: hypothetical protein JWR07_4775 [Nevskia sp.]|nr:hypothetical protein [Nevskia sp.]
MHGMVLALHVAVGAVALLGFWTAALAPKGRPLHRLAGRIYLWAMGGILLTALPLALSYFGRGQALLGVFFLYLEVLVGTSVVVGPRAVRLKQDFAAFSSGIYPALAWAQLGSGLAVAAIGLWAGQVLLTVFGLVGVGRSAQMLVQRLRSPAPGWWLREHFTAMIANGIATHIAFLGIGLMRILPANLAARLADLHLAWFAPLTVGVGAIVWLRVRHQRRFARRRPATSQASAASVSG